MNKNVILRYIDDFCSVGVLLALAYLVSSIVLVYLAHIYNIFFRQQIFPILAESIVVSFPETTLLSTICDYIIKYGPWIGGYVFIAGTFLFLTSILTELVPEVYWWAKKKLS